VRTIVDQDQATSAVINDEAEVLLWFGASVLAAGNTASRTREWIDVPAHKMGFDTVSVNLSFESNWGLGDGISNGAVLQLVVTPAPISEAPMT
jgi:hypothetical protein